MKVINYTQTYESQVVALWNKALWADTITLDQFRKQILLDENFNPSLCGIAIEKAQCVGFILGIKRQFPYLERGLEPKQGWISVLFTDPAHGRRGIATALVDFVERGLAQRGVKTITLGAYSPNYFFPGIDKAAYPHGAPFFEGRGYVAGHRAYSMSKSLRDYRHTSAFKDRLKAAQKAGYSFKAFDYSYALDLLDFAATAFGGGWKRNVLLSMGANQAQDCILLALDQSGAIVGFCMRMIDGNPMRFGPIGVKDTARNDGIGGILFDLMQEEMKKRRIYFLYFVSTEENGKRFYERHGLKVDRIYTAYQKQCNNTKGGDYNDK